MKPSKFAQPFRDYEILDRLGSGGMGTVFKARRRSDGAVVALKVLRPSYSRNQRYVERLRREAVISMRLDHPNLVKGLGMGEEGGYHYLVMEFVEGKSLKEMLKTWGRFPEEQVLSVGIQLAEALAYAHDNGVVHRDVKPGNVLVDDEDRVKLTDLGLAKGDTDMTLTRDGSTVGTPQYMSPEQARDPQLVDARSDLYSLGATLYHMAVGLPPFEGESVVQVITKLLHERADSAGALNPDLSTGLNLILRRLLAKDPALRYQTAGELLADLRRVQTGQAPSVDVKALERAEGRRRGLSRRVRVALALAGLAAAAALWWLLQPPPPQGVDELERLASAVRQQGDPRAKLLRIDAYTPTSAERSAWQALRDGVVQELRQAVETFTRELTEEDFLRWVEANGASSWRQRYLRQHVEDRFAKRLGLRPTELPGPAHDAWEAFLSRHGPALATANERRLAGIVQRLQAAWEECGAPLVAKAREQRDWAAADSFVARLTDDPWSMGAAEATPIPRLVDEEKVLLVPLERKLVEERARLRQEASRAVESYRGRVLAEVERVRQRVREGYVAGAEALLAACRQRLTGAKPWVSLPEGIESPVAQLEQEIERARHELEARILAVETQELAWREDTVHWVLARDLDVSRAKSFLDGVVLLSPEAKRERELLRADLEALQGTIAWLLGRIEERRGQQLAWWLQRGIVDGRLQRVQRGDKPGEKPGVVLALPGGEERVVALSELDRLRLVDTFGRSNDETQRLGLGLLLFYGDQFAEGLELLADTERYRSYLAKQARRKQQVDEIGRSREAQARRLLAHLESLLPEPGLPFRDPAATRQDLDELSTSFADTAVVAEATPLLERVRGELRHEERRLELLGRLPAALQTGVRLTLDGGQAGAPLRFELDPARQVLPTSDADLVGGWLATPEGLAAPPAAGEAASELGGTLHLPLPILDERSEVRVKFTLLVGSPTRGTDLVQLDCLGTRILLVQPPGEPALAVADAKVEAAAAARGGRGREAAPSWYLLAGGRYDVEVELGAVQNLKRSVVVRVNGQDVGIQPARAAAAAPVAALGLAAVGDLVLARLVIEARTAK